ncbi:MAG: hypothetical protein R2865_03510 [Deinococcales bacterium]
MRQTGILSAAVGMITSAAQAEHILRTEQADLILLGRELLRNPYWLLQAAQELKQDSAWRCSMRGLSKLKTFGSRLVTLTQMWLNFWSLKLNRHSPCGN